MGGVSVVSAAYVPLICVGRLLTSSFVPDGFAESGVRAQTGRIRPRDLHLNRSHISLLT